MVVCLLMCQQAHSSSDQVRYNDPQADGGWLRLRVTNTLRQQFFLVEAPASIQSVRQTVKGNLSQNVATLFIAVQVSTV
jgi:hypothetical protein